MMRAATAAMIGGSNKEDAMYKEIFLACVRGVVEDKTLLISSSDVTYVGPHFLDGRQWGPNATQYGVGKIAIDFPNCTQCGTGSLGACFSKCGLVSVNLPSLSIMYGQENFASFEGTEISLPSLTNFANHAFSSSRTLKTLNLPSVTSKTGNFFVYNDSALENVYLPKMTLADLGGASYLTQQKCNSAAVFHLKDGDYDYHGNPIS